jgi:transposase-like protein
MSQLDPNGARMNIVERGRRFLDSLRALADRTAWEWRRCPRCGDTLTQKWGVYQRHPWFLSGRQEVVVQRHRCLHCRRTYSEQSAYLVRGGWYAREIRRRAIDHWQHLGGSVRTVAEDLRSFLGHQERWLLWRPLDPVPDAAQQCHLHASSVQRWLDEAGQTAQTTVAGQLAGVASSGQLATDGLWARLRGETRRVVLLVADGVTGVIWPPVVVAGEEMAEHWQRVFERARDAGLILALIRGVTSDGAKGLARYLATTLTWVSHQRCVFHLWRTLASELTARGNDAALGLKGEAATHARREARRELGGLIRAIFDAPTHRDAQTAFTHLAAHRWGKDLAHLIDAHLDEALVHLLEYNQALVRTTPEWIWRDFRRRVSHGRNHGTATRLERAALLFAIYHNFEPAQERREPTRHYRHPGLCPLAVAGVPPNGVSYLDALRV